MSKLGFFARYVLIIKKLHSKPYSTFEEIQSYVSQNIGNYSESAVGSVGLSLRTFQRDIVDIEELMKLKISYSRAQKGYYLNHGIMDVDDKTKIIIDSFDMLNLASRYSDVTPYIQFERRKPRGAEHIPTFARAIQQNKFVRFNYHKFWDDSFSTRELKPLALKQSINRWYLVAFDDKDNHIKTFGLDRVGNVEILNKKFIPNPDFNLEEKFKYSFGITTPYGAKPEKVKLLFEHNQGKYIQALPLHESQKVISNDKNGLLIELDVYNTIDFQMEILSHGASVKVLEPESLKNKIKAILEQTLAIYQ